ncbi:MAG: type III-A CRISPR-associated RAMP protein Csm5 [Moorellaceae bacterium]
MRNLEVIVEVLSPLHIGGAPGRLGSMDFFQDRQKIYLVDEKAWAEALNKMAGVDYFVQYAEQDRRPSLDTYLEKLKPAIADTLRQAVLRCIPKCESFKVSNLRSFITELGSGGVYLPGSSLKGALRGALLYRLAESERKLAEFKKKALGKKLKNLTWRWNYFRAKPFGSKYLTENPPPQLASATGIRLNKT